MSFTTDFSKSLKTISQEFKATANQMISNGCNFSCQCLNISSIKDDETIYPDANDLSEWIIKFMEIELRPKPLNPRALVEMQKRGIKPKKQINDILLVCIIPSNTQIHIGVSIPKDMNIDIDDFIQSAIKMYNHTNINIKVEYNNFGYSNILHDDPFKERDNVLRCFFNELKNRNIYIDEDEDEEVINYFDD
jgi:hypothetical protein